MMTDNVTGRVGEVIELGLLGRRVFIVFFFFSSRRRHTRFDCDWSSDVCSSDLVSAATIAVALAGSGMIVGVLTRTGSALAFGGAVLSASMGSLLVAMILIFLEIGRASCRERV